MLGRHTPRGSDRSDDLYSGQVHGSGEREAVADAQHLFVPASDEARLYLLKVALRVSLGLVDPLSVQCV